MRLAQALGAQVVGPARRHEREAVPAHADAVVAHFVHQVYNNAGIAYNGNVDKSGSGHQRVIDVDFWGVVSGASALPHVICLRRRFTSSTSPACSG